MAVRIVESSTISRSSDHECEDIALEVRKGRELVYAGIVDGATDKSGLRHEGGRTGGRLAAETIVETVESMDPDMDPFSAVEAMTRAVAELRSRLNIPDESTTPPSAAMSILSLRRRELWRIGDVHMAVRVGRQMTPYPGEKGVDVAASLARAAYTACLISAGFDPEEIARDDPGRRFILPLLEAQGTLANAPMLTAFAYGVLDGTPVPSRLIEVLPLPATACEIILASDGYISAAPSFREAEEQLQVSLSKDPLRIGVNRGTKGLRPGADSFDDRTYLRVTLDAVKSERIVQTTESVRRRFWQEAGS